MTPTSIVAYLALFATVGLLFLFVALLLGRFLRPKAPTAQKLEIYECGEPAVGSRFVQFDLRFYVVALLFLIFDVEVAFFFPWAVVFGKATQLTDPRIYRVEAPSKAAESGLSLPVAQRLRELGIRQPGLPDPAASAEENSRLIQTRANQLALTAMADLAVFFAVLLVGFAYVWYRGDLTWVRAIGRPRDALAEKAPRALVHAESR
jgi:NADH-quinone oxidoreductase subunit A